MKRLPPDARRVLDAARAAVEPSAAQRARADAALRAALDRHGISDLPPLAPPATVQVGAGSGATLGLGLKLGVAAALVAVGLFFALRGAAPPAPAPRAAAAPPPPAAASAEPAAVAAPAEAPVGQLKGAEVARAAAPATAPPRRHAMPSDEALQAELRLVAEANALLQNEQFDAALRVLARHRERFPQGTLHAERDGLRVLSLCGLGTTERARRERERYLRLESHSPLAARVRAACSETAQP